MPMRLLAKLPSIVLLYIQALLMLITAVLTYTRMVIKLVRVYTRCLLLNTLTGHARLPA